jgi:hypothetical protein
MLLEQSLSERFILALARLIYNIILFMHSLMKADLELFVPDEFDFKHLASDLRSA